MLSRTSAGLLVFAAVILTYGVCLASIPFPPLCIIEASGGGTCSPNAAVCPAGDFDVVTVTITLYDEYGMPVASQPVEVWPDPAATGFAFCPGEEVQTGTTNADGEATVAFRYFGGCGDLGFYAECLYVPIGPSEAIYIASCDNDGDLEIALLDFIGFAGDYLTSDPCSDFNCDGAVDLNDFIVFASHYMHTCE